MKKKLFDVEIVKEGETYIARIIMPDGDMSSIESESLEELLDHLTTEITDRFS